jgi:hypothetical protein
MKQGVLTNTRVRLLLRDGLSCYRARRAGERKRKSVRGCIVGADLAVLNLVVIKKVCGLSGAAMDELTLTSLYCLPTGRTRCCRFDRYPDSSQIGPQESFQDQKALQLVQD